MTIYYRKIYLKLLIPILE